MRALIGGVSGQDGAYLSQLLLGKGYEVIGTSRDAATTSFSNLTRLGIQRQIQTVSMAVNDFRSVLTVLKRYSPDEIYNLAGQSSVGLSFEQPVETIDSIVIGTLNLLEAIRLSDLPMRFYNASSGECFGNTGANAANEETPFRPRSPYAVAKAAAHGLVGNYREAYALYACSGILFNHESPLRSERFVTQKIVRSAFRIASGSDEKLFLGNLNIQRDWGWAPEYVEGMYAMLQQDVPNDYVLATGNALSLQTFVEVAFSTFGLNWQDHVEVDRSLLRPSDITSSKGDSSLAAAALGWKPRCWGEGVVKAMCEAAAAQDPVSHSE